jgi:hypothetical protein
MLSELFTRLADYLIARAKQTPYWHLRDGEYMLRYWLVPYRHDDGSGTTGPVKFTERPLAWLLQLFDIAARIHVIKSSDNDRASHNHPWPYITVILRGGYFEHRYDVGGVLVSSMWHGPGSVLFRWSTSLHRLEVFNGEPATTLFITFKKRHSWGFMTNYRHYKGEQ